MKILENELLIQYDSERRELSIYRLIDGSPEKILHTAYPLSKLKEKGIAEAGRLIGEDILLSFEQTRAELAGE
jgi:hypothetical protein